jgi:2'-deoxynucleoside 5'-phosphate N-hydrolase
MVSGGPLWTRCSIQTDEPAIGRAYIAIKYHPDQRNRERIERITAALTRMGLDTVCIVRDLEAWGRVTVDAKTLMQKSFDAIDASQLVVIDLTEKGVGIGIEAGYGYARNVPIVVIAETGADISTTLQGIAESVGFYSNAQELEQALAAALPNLSASAKTDIPAPCARGNDW